MTAAQRKLLDAVKAAPGGMLRIRGPQVATARALAAQCLVELVDDGPAGGGDGQRWFVRVRPAKSPHETAAALGHVPLRQGNAFECSRCDCSGSVVGDTVRLGLIFTRECAPAVRDRKVRAVCAIMDASSFDRDGGDGLGWSTRENGDMETDTAGAADIAAARTLRGRIFAEVPDAKVRIETVDEWTLITVEIP